MFFFSTWPDSCAKSSALRSGTAACRLCVRAPLCPAAAAAAPALVLVPVDLPALVLVPVGLPALVLVPVTEQVHDDQAVVRGRGLGCQNTRGLSFYFKMINSFEYK